MRTWRMLGLAGLALALATDASAQKKAPKPVEISDQMVREMAASLLNDPRQRVAPECARLILLYTLQSPNVEIVLDENEFGWVDLGRDDEQSLLLLGSYLAGNIQSQLNSGVKRNDRYSGVLTLFRVYRSLQEQAKKKEKQFTITTVESLLALHQEGRLVGYLQKLDEKKPAKLTREAEEVLRRLRQRR
jgi:hypothetical protein